METIKIEGETIAVADLPDNLKNQVALSEHIAVQMVEARKQMGMVELARSEAARQLTVGYKQFKAAQAEESAAVASEPTANEVTE